MQGKTLSFTDPLQQAHEVTFKEKLGEGAEGEVWMGLYKNQKMAIKCYKALSTEEIEREQRNLNLYDRLLGTGQIENIPCSVMSFHEGTNGLDELYEINYSVSRESPDRFISKKNLPYLKKCKLALAVIQAVIDCHEKNLAHRDLKTENLLINTEQHVTLIDLGSALLIEGETATSIRRAAGTQGYMAPELLFYTQGPLPAFNAADLFSLGVILGEIFTDNNFQKILRERNESADTSQPIEELKLEDTLQMVNDALENLKAMPSELRQHQKQVTAIMKGLLTPVESRSKLPELKIQYEQLKLLLSQKIIDTPKSGSRIHRAPSNGSKLNIKNLSIKKEPLNHSSGKSVHFDESSCSSQSSKSFHSPKSESSYKNTQVIRKSDTPLFALVSNNSSTSRKPRKKITMEHFLGEKKPENNKDGHAASAPENEHPASDPQNANPASDLQNANPASDPQNSLPPSNLKNDRLIHHKFF